MNTLAEVCARDLMQTDLHTISADAPVSEAIESLEDNRITGLVVEDGAGRLVGVLSSSDVARIEHLRAGHLTETHGDYDPANPTGEAMGEELPEDEQFVGREDYSMELLGRECVRDWMTPRIISVGPDASLREVCEVMLREGIHRVLVVEGNTLRGMISTMDIVRHLATNL